MSGSLDVEAPIHAKHHNLVSEGPRAKNSHDAQKHDAGVRMRLLNFRSEL